MRMQIQYIDVAENFFYSIFYVWNKILIFSMLSAIFILKNPWILKFINLELKYQSVAQLCIIIYWLKTESKLQCRSSNDLENGVQTKCIRQYKWRENVAQNPFFQHRNEINTGVDYKVDHFTTLIDILAKILDEIIQKR